MKLGIIMSSQGKGRILTLRLILILAIAMLLLPPDLNTPAPLLGSLLVGLFLISNAFLVMLPEKKLLTRRWDFFLVVTDTFLIALGLFYANQGRPELPVAFFVILLLSALGRDLLRTVTSATVVAGFYLFLVHRTGLNETITASQAMLQIPFLYISGLYYGSAVMRVRLEQDRYTNLETERRKLETILSITTATTSTLDLSSVLNSIVQKVADMVGAIRCSIALLKDSGRQCIVMASSDDVVLEPRILDLEKYPEFRRAIDSRDTVVIHDVGKEPMMRDVRPLLEKKNFLSILVVPILFEKEILGLLSVRSAHSQKWFSPTEIKACQVVANASANALKNAILFDEKQKEMFQRKATSEKLQNIMEHFPDLIFMTDSRGTITDFNRGGEKLLGLSRDRVIGFPASTLFAGGELPLSVDQLRKRGGAVSNYQVLLKTSENELRHGIAASAALHDEAGEPTGIVAICKDITDLKQALKQLQEAQNLSTLKTVSNQAQEIQQFLTGIFQAVVNLNIEIEDPDTRQKGKRILEMAQGGQKSVQNLLTFIHRFSKGQNSIKSQAVSLPPDDSNNSPLPESLGKMSRKRVLVVDDDEAILTLLKEGLEEFGYEVVTSVSGSDAFKKIIGTEWALVITDYLMPHGDGKMLYDLVRRVNPPLAKKMIFITGLPFDKDLVRFISSTKCPFLKKPLHFPSLLETIDTVSTQIH